MGDVVVLKGPTRLDIPAERVLQAALDAGLESVVICGFDKEGNEYFASSIADGADVVWLVERCKLATFRAADELSE